MNTSMNDSGVDILNDSTSSNESTKRLQREENVVPLMIGEITHSSGELKVWGMPVHILTIIGILHKVEISTTKITYEIADETGTIKCVRWLETNRTLQEPTLEINTYVRVYGLVRNKDGQRHIFILRILSLVDLNELTNHLLEVTYATLKAQRRAASSKADSNLTDDLNLSNDCNSMTKEQAIVFKIIKDRNNTEGGIERCDIKRHVSTRILSQVDDIIDFLISEGYIYTTNSEDHFKSI